MPGRSIPASRAIPVRAADILRTVPGPAIHFVAIVGLAACALGCSRTAPPAGTGEPSPSTAGVAASAPAAPEAGPKILSEGHWEGWRIWPSPAGDRIALTYQEAGTRARHFMILRTTGGGEEAVGELAVRAGEGGAPVDARWSPDGRRLAVEFEAYEAAWIVLLEVEPAAARAIAFDGLPGSRSPRWDRDGSSLYFTPLLLDGDESERGLYRYDVATRRIERMLPDLYVSGEVAVAGGMLFGVRTLTPGPGLFSIPLDALRASAAPVASWDDAQHRFVPVGTTP